MQIFNTMTRKKEDFIPQEPGVSHLRLRPYGV